jgi:hypothetical protein
MYIFTLVITSYLFIFAGRRFTRWTPRETTLVKNHFNDWITGIRPTGPGEA